MQRILTAWLQLLDASHIEQSGTVDKFLRELGADDDSWETGDQEPLWNPNFHSLLRYSVLYWGGGPPDFKRKLEDVKQFLKDGEFLMFSATYGLGHRQSVQEFVVVTKAGAYYAGTHSLAEALIISAQKHALMKAGIEKGDESALVHQSSPQASGSEGNGFPESLINSI